MKDLKTLREEQLRIEGIAALDGVQKDAAKDWEDLLNYGEMLDLPLTLGQFVPCNAEGEPIEEPYEEGCKAKSNNCYGDPCVCKKYDEKVKAYEKAKEAVIFEGWSYVQTGETFYIENKHFGMDWYGNDGSIRLVARLSCGGFAVKCKTVSTINDLTEATKDNKIKLKQ